METTIVYWGNIGIMENNNVMQLQNWSQLSSVFVVGVWHTLQLQGSKFTVRDTPHKMLLLSLPYCLQ